MATYAIGDLQGCFDELQQLLVTIDYDPAHDTLWFAGDLINRGPKSLETLRFVKGLGERAVTVLGNHDLHALAVAAGYGKKLTQDTLLPLLNASDSDELFAWLREQPLMHHDAELGYTMVHAGLLPQWDLVTAQACAAEVEVVLRGSGYLEFLSQMYGNRPVHWSTELSGIERLRFITNVFTRLRFCSVAGELNLEDKGAPGSQRSGFEPWFDVAGRKNSELKILFGHWSMLKVGSYREVFALDSGCLWGGAMTALRLDGEAQWFSVDCRLACDPVSVS